VKFRRPPIGRVRHADRNYVRFRLGPDLAIGVGARVKGSGEAANTTPIELLAVGQQSGDEISAYERLIADAMNGDPLLFARADGVETMWDLTDPLVCAATPAIEYERGTWGPAQAESVAADIGGWENPRVEGRA
jgi:glucose-6-phosphate 1-dehydrogenase